MKFSAIVQALSLAVVKVRGVIASSCGQMDDIPPTPYISWKEDDVSSTVATPTPLYIQLLSQRYIAIYGHYAALGLIMSSVNLATNACYYFYDGADNICACAWSLIVIPWGLKLLYAFLIDTYSGPFGESQRRKMYLCLGWCAVLVITLVLSLCAAEISVQVWIGLCLLAQIFTVLADTTVDGLCIQLGQLEPLAERGQVLATGQRVKLVFVLLGAFIQAVLVNGPSCNPPHCHEDRPKSGTYGGCWSWGLTLPQYYALLFCMLLLMLLPLLVFVDPTFSRPKSLRPEASESPLPVTFDDHQKLLWDTLSQPTTLFLLVFVAGNNLFSQIMSIVQWYVQYELISMSNFESGISSVLSAFAAAIAVYLFQTYFRHANWRLTQYANVIFCATMSLGWILVYHNTLGLMNVWFSVFLQINMAIGGTVTQVLSGMAIIELAPAGQETVTYEVILTTANSAIIIANLLATQLLAIMGIDTCVRSLHNSCSGNPSAVNLHGKLAFKATQGPQKFTNYSVVIFCINMAGMMLFTRFLPSGKQQCRGWRGGDAAHMGALGGASLNPSPSVLELADTPRARHDGRDVKMSPLGHVGESNATNQWGVEMSPLAAAEMGCNCDDGHINDTTVGHEGRMERSPPAAPPAAPAHTTSPLFSRILPGRRVAVASMVLCGALLLYQVVYAFGLLIPQASCSPAFGGAGC